MCIKQHCIIVGLLCKKKYANLLSEKKRERKDWIEIT